VGACTIQYISFSVLGVDYLSDLYANLLCIEPKSAEAVASFWLVPFWEKRKKQTNEDAEYIKTK
jgi:hypothetical protein